MTASGTLPRAGIMHSKFFAGIPDHDQQLIIGIAQERHVSAKEVVIQCGDKASCLFLLCEGNMKYYRVTERGEELILWWLTPGDVFGLATILKNPPRYMGSAESKKECKLWVWDHASIRKLSGVYPQLSENALRITLGFLASYVDRHTGIATKTAEQRLANTLLQLGHRTGHAHATGVDIDITNEQLGSLSDVGMFTTSRVLSRWERAGTIAKARGKVCIHAPERLLKD